MGWQNDGRFLLYNHLLFPGGLTANVLWALSSLVFLFLLLRAENNKNKLGKMVWLYLYILHMPNSAYLFLEIKHLILKDTIADPVSVGSFAVFGGLSMVGLALSVVQTYFIATKVRPFTSAPRRSIAILSALSGWGVALGLINLTTVMGLINPYQIMAYTFRLTFTLWMVLIGFAVLNTVLTLAFYQIQRKRLG